MMDGDIIDIEMHDLESNLEPLTRTRSNTWPMPQPEGYKDGPLINGTSMTDSDKFMKIDISTPENHYVHSVELPSIKKKSSRRNAWGSLSYAELITLAITSVKDQRLTLSQIYGWMIKNVPFFKDKGDSNSSAGWKNSVRHNLSLHNRFIRVPNEGAGKSSWWMINPNAKTGKSTRRRAASMETGKYERKRSRARKKAENLEKENFQTNLISSLVGSNRERVDYSFVNIQPTTRTVKSLTIPSRISSFASTGGRLSPFPTTSNETEYPAKYTCTLEQVPASKFEIAQPMLFQDMQQTLQNKVDLSTTRCQIDEHVSACTDVQMIPIAAYTLAQSSDLCILHRQRYCTCNVNIVQIASALSPILKESDQANHCFSNTYENQLSNVSATRSALRSIQESNQISSVTLQVDNNMESEATNAPLLRNNSLLDDIDEIIKREQYTSVDIVNDSMTSALYISKNLKKHSWIH